jgi:hypothetical protein
MATIDLGRLGFVNKGTYNNSTTYEKNDLVQFTDGGILSTYLYIDSTAQSGQAPSSSGTAGSRWVYFAKGVADAVASAGNNKVLVTDGSGNLSPLSIGSATQILQVNSGANGYEFVAKPEGKVKQIVTAVASGVTNGTTATSGYSGGALGNVGTNHISANITPTSSSSKLIIMANAICGVGNNGLGLTGVWVDNVAHGAANTAGYGSDGSVAAITCFAQNSSTSQRTVDFRTVGEWGGNDCKLGAYRGGNTLSTNGNYGNLIIMEVE